VSERALRLPAGRPAVALLAALPAVCLVALVLEPGLADGVLAPIATAVVAYLCGAHLKSWRSGLAAAALLAAVAALSDALVPAAIATLAPWWIGYEVRRRRLVIAALVQRNRELEAEQEAFARLSVRRERARVARELHDIIGHHLAVIVVQAGAGRMAGDHVKHAAERLAGIRASAQEALIELARLIDVLHADAEAEAPGERIAQLLERAGSAGMQLAVTVAPEDLALDAEVEDAAYRVVQEGPTNVLKHAPGAVVDVRLIRGDDTLQVSVRNSIDDAASSLAAAGSGLGLAGMRERVVALGGALAFGSSAHGDWVVEARVPLRAPTVTPAAVTDLAPPLRG
jgi:signal transduction histidine kinase